MLVPFSVHNDAIRTGLAALDGQVQLHCVRCTLLGGITGAYQTVLSSFVQRARSHCDRSADDHSTKIIILEKLLRRTLLFFCDDDIELIGKNAIMSAYYQTTFHGATTMGKWELRNGSNPDLLGGILTDVMRLFLNLKQEINANALPPHGVSLERVIEHGGMDSTIDFGDQVYFAKLALDHPTHVVPVYATINESDYPSNGRFLRDLRRFMHGDDNDALVIFRNLTKIERHSGCRYSIHDIKRLISVLETRDPARIADITKYLLRALPTSPQWDNRQTWGGFNKPTEISS
uniref:Uncharacterized protein n=1 Tax=Candidatus Kentrum sp. SD TaxID=2126332 RepID=A0A450YXY0_9GAMM|nr:MAG: hypothetical protein BECKSD772F_GA0070984_107020 [Candidatus Kentron sp. SD]VFK46402.1 MAG: hypothetical protein BECKSD772E_GA0070983_107220 [Candidatus Kentron sp. SD]